MSAASSIHSSTGVVHIQLLAKKEMACMYIDGVSIVTDNINMRCGPQLVEFIMSLLWDCM